MRAKNKIFHLECFRCVACQKQLIPGEEFALQDDGTLFCKEDTRHILTEFGTIDSSRIYGPKINVKSEENNNSQDNVNCENNDDGEEGDHLDRGVRGSSGGNLKDEDSIDPDDEMISIKSEEDFVVKTEKCDSSSSSFAKIYEGRNSNLNTKFF